MEINNFYRGSGIRASFFSYNIELLNIYDKIFTCGISLEEIKKCAK